MNAESAYQAHETLVAPGRAKSHIWRILAGLGIIAGVSYALNLGAFLLVLQLSSAADLAAVVQGSTPAAMLLVLVTFGFMALGAGVAARLLQGRSFVSLVGPLAPLLHQFTRVFLRLLIVFGIVLVLPPYDFGAPLVPNLALSLWLGLLPLSLLAVLVQVSAEEVVFRGYLQQALAARFQNPLIWLLLPSALFGLAHYMPQEAGDNAWLLCLWAMGFGLVTADLTARAGTLGPAIAVHFFNNIVALLVVASPSSLNGLGLYLLPYDLSDVAGLRPWLMVDCATMLVAWLVARLAIRR
ncbi:CPBP family intramembrane glutamic endopeptidase [Pseudophaeobacter profundi]|jgi:membrane protease YdiL (CAAX protease family)|uniref:CPBP family intramembrane glutamic endopeptidase n=1 Tax=Pseudophaeobacter profundi TaxID=3034152 RepID=UPI00242DF686|nr:type II CAAX endopeptidase family protein [Pseudophaeobacter profundi]